MLCNAHQTKSVVIIIVIIILIIKLLSDVPWLTFIPEIATERAMFSVRVAAKKLNVLMMLSGTQSLIIGLQIRYKGDDVMIYRM